MIDPYIDPYFNDLNDYYSGKENFDNTKKCISLINREISKMALCQDKENPYFKDISPEEIRNLVYNQNSSLGKDIHLSNIGYLVIIQKLEDETKKKIDYLKTVSEIKIKDLAQIFSF